MFEFVRLKDKFIFDEVAITKIHFVPEGREVHFEYERHGHRLTDLMPIIVPGIDFAKMRNNAKTVDDIATTDFIKRVFWSGAKQFNDRQVVAKEDFAADMDWLDQMTLKTP